MIVYWENSDHAESAYFNLKHSGSKDEPKQMAVKHDIGKSPGGSAIIGAMIVLNRATKLQIPKAVATKVVGNSCGMAM